LINVVSFARHGRQHGNNLAIFLGGPAAAEDLSDKRAKCGETVCDNPNPWLKKRPESHLWKVDIGGAKLPDESESHERAYASTVS